jgi:hypothetical protein
MFYTKWVFLKDRWTEIDAHYHIWNRLEICLEMKIILLKLGEYVVLYVWRRFSRFAKLHKTQKSHF